MSDTSRSVDCRQTLARFLTSDGTDDDSKAEMAGDHTTPADFYVGPAGEAVWVVTELIWVISDTTLTPTAFGDAGFLTNGLHFAVTEDDGATELVNLNGGFPIKAPWQAMHSGWKYVTLDATGTDVMQLIYEFKVPIRLYGRSDDRIECQLSDNLAALSDFYVMAKGHIA